MKMSEQHLSEQLITCGSKMQRDREGLAKTNYTDLIDKWEQGPGPGHTEAAMLAEKHTHIKSHSHIFLLTAVHGRLREPQRSEGCL